MMVGDRRSAVSLVFPHAPLKEMFLMSLGCAVAPAVMCCEVKLFDSRRGAPSLDRPVLFLIPFCFLFYMFGLHDFHFIKECFRIAINSKSTDEILVECIKTRFFF